MHIIRVSKYTSTSNTFLSYHIRRSVLMQNLVLTLQQSQSPHVLSAVQQLVSVAVERVPSDTDCKLTVINGESSV